MKQFFSLFDRYYNKLTFIGLLLLALAIRLALLPIVTDDQEGFLLPWCNYIREHGGFWAFKDRFSDYSPLYLYYLLAITSLNLDGTVAIKLFSILFDFYTSYQIFKMLQLKWGERIWPYAAAMAFLFSPTFLLNSSMWGQCDVIYACVALISVSHLLRQRYGIAFVFYGISFALKFQAVFLLPFFIVLFLKERKFPLWHFLLLPGIYFISIVPCWIAGRPLIDLLLIYFNQMSTYDILAMLAPSLWQWIPAQPEYLKLFALAGILLTTAVVLIFSWLIVKSPGHLSNEMTLKVACLFLIAIPFSLPRMHERYFYMAELFSLVYAFYALKDFYLPLILIGVSSFGYVSYLFLDETDVGFSYLAFVLLLTLSYFTYQLVKELWPNSLLQDKKAL